MRRIFENGKKSRRIFENCIFENGGNPPDFIEKHQNHRRRNRYLACREIGVEPLAVPSKQWNGEGTPESYVISKNLVRRHLNESQRGIIGAKLATLKRGDVDSQESDGRIRPPSAEEAANMLNIGITSIKLAKKILSEGTPEEIAAVEAGEVAVSTIAKKIKKREKETADAAVWCLASGLRVRCRGALPQRA